MKKSLFILLLAALGSLLPAQQVAVSYEIEQQDGDKATLQVYLQSLSDEARAIGALNFSLAMPAGCIRVTGQESMLSEAWTDFLQEVQLVEELDLNYGNWHYSQRWQYGSADPGMPATAAILAPAQGEAPLRVMEISLEGNCADKLYLETQEENNLNQMGDGGMQPIDWVVIHPKTELELAEGLKMNIFPNPVVKELSIEANGLRENAYQITLSSMEGRQIWTQEWPASGPSTWTTDLGELPAAVYLLSISSQGNTQQQSIRIIKK